MALDRTGEPLEAKPLPPCGRPGCRGFNGYDDELRPIPCYVCRPHLRRLSSDNDYAERTPSARAQAAIDRDNERD
ncbi:hypothetical protein [Nocardia otitidiscaviarum]|uniref:hypothetical protein n=1 Tax=Nocardia otitidiscaviarum TaxID=1823 RepID=UPI000A40334B|nr:hypothetical protein [Nocardia otitidiscaviarum]